MAPPDAWELTWSGKQPPAPEAPPGLVRIGGAADPAAGRLILGDNLGVLRALLPEFAGRVDLVYLDPPYNTGRRQRCPASGAGYADSWGGPAGYLSMLYPRVQLCRDLLAPTGSLIAHVNWRVGHWVQCLLDEVFGPGEREGRGRAGFRNEIVWGYGGGGSAPRAYRRKHDNLFWYTRGDRWTFHPQFRPYTPGTLARGLTAVKGDRYRLRDEGAALETWWTDPGVGKVLSPTAREQTGYPTQKPEGLLERLLLGHTDPGALVLDPFCGSGTTAVVAQHLGRRWLAVDDNSTALEVAAARLPPDAFGRWEARPGPNADGVQGGIGDPEAGPRT